MRYNCKINYCCGISQGKMDINGRRKERRSMIEWMESNVTFAWLKIQQLDLILSALDDRLSPAGRNNLHSLLQLSNHVHDQRREGMLFSPDHSTSAAGSAPMSNLPKGTAVLPGGLLAERSGVRVCGCGSGGGGGGCRRGESGLGGESGC